MSLPALTGLSAPALWLNADNRTKHAFLEFFAVSIRNHHTRKAYVRAIRDLLEFCEHRAVPSVPAIDSIDVAAWIASLERRCAPSTVKQHLAAARMAFDWLVLRQITSKNPAQHVKGPRYSLRVGKTPTLDAGCFRHLLGSIDAGTICGARDAALIGLMTFTFARVGACLAMDAKDVVDRGRRLWVCLVEKGGRYHEMPCNHTLEDILAHYIRLADLAPTDPLFQSLTPGGGLSGQRLYANAYAMVKRRVRAAGLPGVLSCHSFRATGITTYLSNGGAIERAAAMANHTSIRTTQLYDRRLDNVTLDEVERIVF